MTDLEKTLKLISDASDRLTQSYDYQRGALDERAKIVAWLLSDDAIALAVRAYVSAGKRGVTNLEQAMREAIQAALQETGETFTHPDNV